MRFSGHRAGQRGALLILAAVASVAMFAVLGLTINVAQAYSLKTELQNIADAAALGGARSLNGTLAGINAAVAEAQAAARANRFNFARVLSLPESRLGFAGSPDASVWKSVGEARAAPEGLLFLRVDTGPQPSLVGEIVNFLGIAGQPALSVAASAVAGRFAIAISPIAVCAVETTKYGRLDHSGLPPELKEFGFRRGLSYNVVDIDPLGGTAQKLLLNPVDIPPGPGDPSACNPDHASASAVAPYLCGGTASIVSTLPGYVYVNTGFSAVLQKEINSRFGDYGGGSNCTPAGGPPDRNVKAYPASANGAGSPRKWMSDPGQQSLSLQGSPRIPLVPPVPQASDYGVLWAYNSAVQYAAAPPARGYAAYGTADWSLLYPTVSGPTPKAMPAYPAGAPYHQGSSSPFFQAPSGGLSGVPDRRVLNLAIVDCATLSASGGNACKTIQVLGIGRFFMTVPASLPDRLDAEFAGLVPDASLTAEVRLYH